MEDRIVIARGFKIARDTFNDFLTSNGVQDILTSCIWEDDEEEITALFRAKGVDCPFRICIPEAYPFDHSDWLYICYTWTFMLSHKKIDNLLDENVPSSFKDLRQLLKVDEPIATYVMNCNVIDRWEPEALAKRYEVSRNEPSFFPLMELTTSRRNL